MKHYHAYAIRRLRRLLVQIDAKHNARELERQLQIVQNSFDKPSWLKPALDAWRDERLPVMDTLQAALDERSWRGLPKV